MRRFLGVRAPVVVVPALLGLAVAVCERRGVSTPITLLILGAVLLALLAVSVAITVRKARRNEATDT